MKSSSAIGPVSIPVKGFGLFTGKKYFAPFKLLCLLLLAMTMFSQLQTDFDSLSSWRNPKNWGSNVSKPESKSYDVPERVYSFDYVHRSYNKRLIDYYKVRSIPYGRVKNILAPLIPSRIRKDFVRYLATALDYAEKYKIDPLWAISVMWTESHFKFSAKSTVGAQGLMQIMPGTGAYIRNKLNRNLLIRYKFRKLHDPDFNIHLGIYYLESLLKRFKGNYVHATVAYNMGPTWVVRRLRRKGPVGVKNQYLDKVSRAYFRLAKAMSRATKVQSHKSIPFNKVILASRGPYTVGEKMALKVSQEASYLKYRWRNYVALNGNGTQTYVLRSDGWIDFYALIALDHSPRFAYIR